MSRCPDARELGAEEQGDRIIIDPAAPHIEPIELWPRDKAFTCLPIVNSGVKGRRPTTHELANSNSALAGSSQTKVVIVNING